MEDKNKGTPTVFIGTSGWTYDHWKNNFYPSDLPKRRWFDFYAERFDTVEINATFYRTFPDKTYLNWKSRAPQGFAYVLKAPKIITHYKKLRDVDADILSFWKSASLLGDTFRLILLQVAPDLPYDPGLLKSALQAFPDPTRIAVEFRNDRWYSTEIENLLASVGATFCNVDYPGHPLTGIVTSPQTYLRLHGRRKWYASDYNTEDLDEIASLTQQLYFHGAKQVFIFFNNDFGGYAPENARSLARLLENELKNNN